MNDNTQKFLEQLAAKLGTTTEYLWGVLLKQAHISATISLIQTLFVILFGIALYNVHKRLLKKDDEKARYSETAYEKYEEGAVIPMIIGLIIFIILCILCFCCIDNIINGYFNPEYWALDKVISSVK